MSLQAARGRCLLLLASAISLPASRAMALESPVRLVTESLPPFSYEEAGVVKGAATDVVRAVMDKAGLRYSLELLPWRRALDTALREKDVFIYSVARTSEREDELVWIGKISDRLLAVYCLKERADLLGRPLSELPDASFAVVQGDATVEVLRSLGFGDRNLHFVRDATSSLASQHVVAGRSDFVVSNPYRFQYLVKGTALEGRFKRHSLIPQSGGYYLAANRATDPALIARVQKAFLALAANGTLQRILDASLPQLLEP